ncbi:MAG: hypothetical protein B7C54_05600 [Acidimicrobiales bacterium mtb01]|nr:hypothetical protein [Actinomycetota bacterium]TEX46674.1 MAG: hypothetical protein B7C54_05600 [Acidimicrobiales bacterium mtb01]
MAISEAQRFELHLGLQKVLGDAMANTLMEHLPPSGWSDVVRIDQLAEVERRINIRIDMLEHRMEGFDRRMDGFDSRLKFAISGGLAFALAMIAMQVQIVISIANL